MNKIFSRVNRFYKKYCFFFDTARRNVVVFGGCSNVMFCLDVACFSNVVFFVCDVATSCFFCDVAFVSNVVFSLRRGHVMFFATWHVFTCLCFSRREDGVRSVLKRHCF